MKKCYCEYENGGKVHGSELGIMCSTTGQWVREYHCKAANYAEGSFGEFCTGPHNKSEAVKWETKDELCSPGTANILIANGLHISVVCQANKNDLTPFLHFASLKQWDAMILPFIKKPFDKK